MDNAKPLSEVAVLVYSPACRVWGFELDTFGYFNFTSFWEYEVVSPWNFNVHLQFFTGCLPSFLCSFGRILHVSYDLFHPLVF